MNLTLIDEILYLIYGSGLLLFMRLFVELFMDSFLLRLWDFKYTDLKNGLS